MKAWIVAGTILIPVLIVVLRRLSGQLGLLADAAAVVSAFGFGILSAFAVLDIRRHDTVYSTEVHRLFDSFWFLAFGGYLGLYLISLLLWSAFKTFRREPS
ncbi:hypothetical protein FE783_02550 [Paenibacillus mesophilus]|uniref:hypothetical protein n=1 Tax=Paenibacillus mesophilus TaxID=2582849 RepID=UPI00110DDB61|nr:hypothetical protein [Paenibacillus mesophilus]TMV53084.1 hypothetical protein FE783_02550 [Paenibacillus mesophilus]